MSALQTKTDEKTELKLENLTTGFISPQQVVSEWDIHEGEVVADLGCGGGYFTIPIARIVGEKGKVFAVDVMEGPMEAVRSKAYLEKLGNIEVIRANLEKRNSLSKWVKANSCNFVVLANVLYTSKKKKAIVQEAKRVLAPKGKLVVIDWIKNVSGVFRNFGPPLDLRIDKKEVRDIITKTGFSFENDFEAGQFHLGMMFKKK